jgi:hypothetical protein
MTQYKNLGENQLIIMAGKVGMQDLELNAEWFDRYGMNFPYKLNIHSQIYNVLMDKVFSDEDADRIILDQANLVRGGGKLNQLTIFDITNELPQRGDVLQSEEGKMRIAGIFPGWECEYMVWADERGLACGVSVEEFKEMYEKGEFTRL